MNDDVIQREIFIQSSMKNVWERINQPAWWVGDAPGPEKVEVAETRVVADTKYGQFTVLIEKENPPNYLACRWASCCPGEEPKQGNSTQVEFTLREIDGGTWLRVVESGFANLTVSPEDKQNFLQENTKGWESQLKVLQKQALD